MIKHEYVIAVTGLVKYRQSPNLKLANGDIECIASSIEILNIATNLPILIDELNSNELNRLSHRVIDLRRKNMQHNIRLRHKISMTIRRYLDDNGFIDIETPYLTLSTPGGARDFLVPSRIHKGNFYALPQSPQIFKQLLMVAGFDRYYQIVKCFRDEELRADRQPEFTQVDIETAFLDANQIRHINEQMIKQVFIGVLNVTLNDFPVMTYADAMRYYGSDKPDLRFDLKLINLNKLFMNSKFSIFANIANESEQKNNQHYKTGIIAIKLPNQIKLSRKNIDEYTNFVAKYGISGLSYIKLLDLKTFEVQSPISKFLDLAEIKNIVLDNNMQNNETLLIAASVDNNVIEAMGQLRIKLANDYELVDNNAWAPVWIIDFPMFEHDKATNTYKPCHHPFTAPKDEDIILLKTNPVMCLSKAYDLVLNGYEIGGGSIRIHSQELQQLIFDTIGLTPDEAKEKFACLLDNLKLGAPPHGGLAFGLDRLAMLMCNGIRGLNLP